MNSLVFSCLIYKSYIVHWANGTENGTNPRYSFCLHCTDCLSARARATDCSRSHGLTVIHSAGRYSNLIRRRINNSSVRSNEKHSNSTQNSVKATDIQINATDVETRKKLFNKHISSIHHGFNITTETTCGRNGLMFTSVLKLFTQLFPALQRTLNYHYMERPLQRLRLISHFHSLYIYIFFIYQIIFGHYEWQ